jgi:uncharacterized protein involved in outer membrane biogenesis
MRWLLRHSRHLATVLILLVGYSLIGFFLLPYVIKAYVFPAVSERLHRPVLVREVEVNPFVLSLRVTGFEIREPDQSALLGFDEFFVNFQAVSLIRRAYVFDTIRLTLPFVSAKVSKEGSLNLVDLAPPVDEQSNGPPPEPDKVPAQIPAVEIGQFEIAQGVVEFRDESKARPFSLDIVPIHIVLKNFFTRPGGENAYAFTAELGKGETLAWEGTLSLDPIRSTGKLSLSDVKLRRLWRYLGDRFQFDLTDGVLAVNGSYNVDMQTSPPTLQIFQAQMQVANLAVGELGGLDPVIVVPVLKVDGVVVDVSKHDVTIGSILVGDARWKAWRNPDGTVNYQTMFAPAEKAKPVRAPEAKPSLAQDEKSWSILLTQVAMENHAIDFEDRMPQTPAHVEIGALSVRTHDVHFPLKGPLPLNVDMFINGAGRVHMDGTVVANPFQADLRLGLKDIAIRPFQPYFQKAVQLDVSAGTVNVDGTLHLAVEHPRAPLLSFDGNAGLASLSLTNRGQDDELASLKSLALNQIHLTVEPTAVSIKEITVQQPTVRVALQSDGRLNFGLLAPAEPGSVVTDQKAKVSTKPKGAPVPVTIGTVRLVKTVATFIDDRFQPSVHMGISELSGTIKGLSSKQLARADVDLAGRVDKVAPLKIIGTINPLSEEAFTDLAITFENMDLTAGGPYSEKYVGYNLSKGKLSFNLKYKISQKQLEAENSIVVDQLTFGEKTNSQDATSLPVLLVVALLQDRKGRIEIDLPIRGDLSDPDFKYGKVVVSTLLNLLTKVVASPFTLLGKLIPGGGGGEELQFIEFQPGSAAVASEETKKIEVLAKALEERPGLSLDITGTADAALDRDALRATKLTGQLHAMQQHERGKAATKDEVLSLEDERRLVTELYEQRRNQLTASEPPQPAGVPSKPLTLQEMKQQLAASLPVDEAELRSLARQRAEQVRDQLIEIGKLAEERVFLQETDPTATGNDKVRTRLTITAGS